MAFLPRFGLFVALALLAGTACSSARVGFPPETGPGADGPTGSALPPPSYPPSVGLDSRIVSVQGLLGDAGHGVAHAEIGAAIDAFFRPAFLSTSTDSIASAYDAFTPRAADQARQHGHVVTNEELAAGMEAIWADRYAADLYLLAADDWARAGTAEVEFEAQGVHRQEGNVHIGIYGSLYLALEADGQWRIFGFELNNTTRTDAAETTTTVTSTTVSE